jgi:DNA-directed RNA polymerase subunit RPC12/RpoP
MNPTPEYIKVVLTVPLKEWKHLRSSATPSISHALIIAQGIQKEIQRKEPEFYICPECTEYHQALPSRSDILCQHCGSVLYEENRVTNFHQLIAGNC